MAHPLYSEWYQHSEIFCMFVVGGMPGFVHRSAHWQNETRGVCAASVKVSWLWTSKKLQVHSHCLIQGVRIGSVILEVYQMGTAVKRKKKGPCTCCETGIGRLMSISCAHSSTKRTSMKPEGSLTITSWTCLSASSPTPTVPESVPTNQSSNGNRRRQHRWH